MTSTRVDGHCKICGNYTQSTSYEFEGFCLACEDKLNNWSKKELVKALAKANQRLW